MRISPSEILKYFLLLANLQEGVRAQDFVKHSKFEFAKRRNHINETVNFLLLATRLATQ
ncbi:hypothetical protein [Campylobacter troglodytis]|uniref:hypothetical protein n=1 Tax=Campylobacter troglodytis TaxID=654363 RepID=UPI00163C6B62|nr:hypothetical protein [Campylobacter troglodytis]